MMTPSKRSPIQLDLKDLSAKPSTAGSHHFVLAAFTTVALLAIYLLLNTPSASTTSPDQEQQLSNVDEPTVDENSSSPTISQQTINQHEPIEVKLPIVSDTNNEQGSAILPDTGIVNDTELVSEGVSTSQEPVLLAMLETDSLANRSQDQGFGKLLTSFKPANNAVVNNPVTDDIEQSKKSDTLTSYKPSAALSTADIETSDTVSDVKHTTELIWSTSKVRKRDTLSQIFNRNDLGSRLAYKLAQLEDAKPLLKIRPGQELILGKDELGALIELKYPVNKFDTLIVRFDEQQNPSIEMEIQEPEIRINNAKATIEHSLLGASQNAGVPLNTMYNFIALFGWQVDFTNDIHKGDHFSIIYEELYLDNEMVGNGKIIAAELMVSGRTLQAVKHEDDDGFIDYFSPNGDGIKGTFLRSPLKFGHITSSFSKNRMHPIKKIWRAHKGVDYGAPRGTPIMATGDGVVRSASRKGGYGKTVIIRHGGKYDTVYAHLNGYAKGIRGGSRVKQGDVIGYVGSTGLATGPHLHYEFRINGIHKNPVTVEFPKSEPIDKKYLPQFKKMSSRWIAELDHLRDIAIAKLQ